MDEQPQEINLNNPKPETEAERVLRESMERGIKRAEESRMVSPLFLIVMMLVIISVAIRLSYFVYGKITSKTPTGPSYQKTATETATDEVDFEIELTEQICFEQTNMCFKYPKDWQAEVIKTDAGEKIKLSDADEYDPNVLEISLGAVSEPEKCDDILKYTRQTVAISELVLQNVSDGETVWARASVKTNTDAKSDSTNLKAGVNYPVIEFETIKKSDRKFAVVGKDNLEACNPTSAVAIVKNSASENRLIRAEFSVQRNKLGANYEARSSVDDAIADLKTERAQTIFEIMASAHDKKAEAAK